MHITYTTQKLNALGRGTLDAPQLGYTKEQCVAVDAKVREERSYAPAQWNVGLGCVDCRRQFAGPCLAGGVLSAVIAFLATHELPEDTHILEVLEQLASFGVPLVLHEDCGALAAFRDILAAFAAGKGEVFNSAVTLAQKLNADVSLLGALTGNLARVDIDTFMLPEEEILEGVRELGGIVERFELKDHTEVEAVVNMIPGETLGRKALPYEPGQPRVFTVDLWVAEPLAFAVNADEKQLAVLAIQLFNCAVLETKGGPDHEVVVRQYEFES